MNPLDGIPPRIKAKLETLARGDLESWVRHVIIMAAEEASPELKTSGLWHIDTGKWASGVGGHVHGNPGLECTIPRCQFPEYRYLCGRKAKDWKAGQAEGLCILPSKHYGMYCRDQHGDNFEALCSTPCASSPVRVSKRVHVGTGVARYDIECPASHPLGSVLATTGGDLEYFDGAGKAIGPQVEWRSAVSAWRGVNKELWP